ncbi:hypothetical protein [Streptomyces sp. HUAS TT20]|uniref:hypothetical protein n=1 Tax=Streptomyces sp. HUAS TT20 TaxID=3447509 RepID=UPI0021DA28C2|nr:hypothetical protein [Streptomyces sp. HUAS 15-9]UXY25270.1 hypothetical protein N8I87_00885 [Streptomyces sp. HUAS 15-9]
MFTAAFGDQLPKAHGAKDKPFPGSAAELAVRLKEIARQSSDTLLLYYVGHGELTATVQRTSTGWRLLPAVADLLCRRARELLDVHRIDDPVQWSPNCTWNTPGP